MDFHDCKGEFDAYRIVFGYATNSVWIRYSKKHPIRSSERDAMRDLAKEEIDDLSVPEFNELADKYAKKMKGLDNPDLDLEEDLWNS